MRIVTVETIAEPKLQAGRPERAVSAVSARVIAEVLKRGLTYCATGEKLQHIAEAVGDVARQRVPGIYLEAGVAMGGSAAVIASAKPREAALRLYDVFDMLPAPGEKDEQRAHEVYQQFLAGQRKASIDRTYLAGVRAGLRETVVRNLASLGIECEADRVELIKGNFQNTLFIDEPVAFAHIDCDWYDSIQLCLNRIVDHVSPGGLLVFDDYKSFSGAKQAVDEWLARDARFRLKQVDDNVIVERLPDPPATGTESVSSSSLEAAGCGKPRVLLLVDRPNWAYDTAAKAIQSRLQDEFEIRIAYVCEKPDLNAWPFDLIYVFFWGETYHQSFVKDPRRVIKEISSHRWANEERYGRLTTPQAAERYLADAGTLTATSKRLQQIFSVVRPVLHTPNGFDPADFQARPRLAGKLRIGWAGNEKDACKGVADILRPAAGTDFELHIAGGKLNQVQMREFYNSIDVLCVASTAEGEPLTLVEGMACGCFPVAVDVGIVPELVRHNVNGLIVERSVAAFRAALQWCAVNLECVRKAGQANAREMLVSRNWDVVAGSWREALRQALQSLRKDTPALEPSASSAGDAEVEREQRKLWERNLGEKLLEWPTRAEAAARLIRGLDLPSRGRLIDLGCGHQTLRPLIPPSLEYIPVDRIARRPDVITLDLNTTLPDGRYTVVTMLGLIEYFSDVRRLLDWAAGHTRFLILSYNDCSDPQRRTRQHWQSTLSIDGLESLLKAVGGSILKKADLGKAEVLYALEFQPSRVEPLGRSNARPRVEARKTLALLSAAVNGDNSGDSLIVGSIQRLLAGADTREFPLLQPLSEAQIDEINACDAAIICGTNLYQHVFACALTTDIIRRIRVPILPLGVGGSAAVGSRPKMDAAGIAAVRMIHERCAVGSVRDPLSLEFVRSLGISNVELTGCPVLFHALREPVFHPADTSRLYLSIRARLLHVNASWNDKAQHTLDRLCREFRPTLVLQSPYDVPIARQLAQEHGLDCVHDEDFRHESMVEAARRASRTAGFRLHFGMVSLSHGKPALLIGTDTRVSSFCEMMGLNYHHVSSYDDEALIRELWSPTPDYSRFRANWRALQNVMIDWFARNGLSCALGREHPRSSGDVPDSKPSARPADHRRLSFATP